MTPLVSVSPGFEPPRMPAEKALEKVRAGKLAEKALEDMKHPPKRIPTGLPGWDAALKGGLLVPSLTVLGAKPKCGKSTIMCYIADAAVQAGHFCFMVDLENGVSRVFKRIVARKAQIGIDEFFSGERGIGPEDRQFDLARREVTDGALGQRLYIETNRRFSEEELEQKVASISATAQSQKRDFLLIVDSLQKLPVANLSDRRSGIDGWLRFFEYLRDKYDVAILATSELKRPPEGQVYRPTEIAFKESGDIEYTADMAITLDRGSAAGDSWIDDPPETQPIRVNIVFNRDGPAGRLRNDLLLEYPYHGLREIEATQPSRAPMQRRGY